jgi:starch synthase
VNILYVTGEAAPFCKTGGLADVSGSLPVALAARGHHVAVMLPLYDTISRQWRREMTFRRFIYVNLAWRHEYCGLFSLEYRGVTWYFVDNEHYFARGRLYGEGDDGERFGFFSRAVLDLLPLLDEMPQVIHCNDWQTALVPVYRQDLTGRWDTLRGIRTVFTIHNIEYQGKFGPNTVADLFGLDRGWYDGGTLDMDGCVNLMKGAMLCADAVTTVSPTYARQLHLSAYAQGMESVVQSCGEKFSGILNGIDTAVFDPATDPVLPAHYSAGSLRGKADCKKALQQELGLQVQSDVPILSVVSRLVGHKGIDLICESLDNIMRTGCQLVLQGSGEEQYENFFRYAENRYKGRLCAYIGYNEDLAHRIYAGSDLFLMPSRSEPCGLSQMIAMRYGAVPIVRQTGGLADTVRSCQMGQEDGNGFVFADYSAFDMQYVISQAVELYRSDLHGFRRVQKRGMTDDFSWNASAGAYEALYEHITDTAR